VDLSSTGEPLEYTSLTTTEEDTLKAIKIILMLVGGIVVLVIGGFFVLMVVGGAADSKQKSDEKKTVDTALTQTAILRLTALELGFEYERNEVSADQKFKDKPLVVTGMVAEIGKDVTDDVYVLLSSGLNLNPIVHATLRKDAIPHAATLAPGNQVNLACIGSGKTMGMPILIACKFEEPGAKPAEPPAQATATQQMPLAQPAKPAPQPDAAMVTQDNFLTLCSARVIPNAKKLGGMSDEDARQHAASVCSDAQPAYDACIQTGASGQSCLSKAVPTSE